MNILSVFDGISCAQISISKRINDYTYYASEVDKYAIQVTQEQFPETIQLGDISNITGMDIPSDIHLMIGGSPCQNLSSRGDKSGLAGEKSRLFYEYIRVLKLCKPTYFLLENVASMSKANRDMISKLIGVEPILINTSSFLPQTRRRYYWTNIPYDAEQIPKITTRTVQDDILEKYVDDKYFYTPEAKHRSFLKTSFNSKPESDLPISRPLKTQSYTGRAACDNCYHTLQQPRSSTCNLRRLVPIEYERLQGIPDHYTSSLSDTQRYKTIGNSFSVPVIDWFFQFMDISTR